MKEFEEEQKDEGAIPSLSESDFLRDFIERKKLENRVLQKIIDNIRPPETDKPSELNNIKKEK